MWFLGAVLVVIAVTSSNIEGFQSNKIITVGNGESFIVKVLPNATLEIRPENVKPDTAFILCQAHSQIKDVTLSMQRNVTHDTSKHGKDVGIVSMVDQDLKWYLISNSTTQINVLVHLTYFSATDPIPGGCNEEFNLKNDPNIELIVRETVADMLFQWSNIGYVNSVIPQCEDKGYQTKLEYLVYVNYMEGGDFTENTYFDVMKKMIVSRDVTKHGTHVKTIQNNGGTKSIANITSYKHQGVVYTVVVRNMLTGAEAAYVSVATYACDLENGECGRKDIAGIILSTVGAIIGLFLLLLGHRYLKTEIFLFGFLMFAIVTYQVIALETEVSLIGGLSLAGIFGLLGGALLLSFWWNCGIPVISVLFIGLVSGYLVSCVIFYTPFANLSYWDSPFNYRATFACGVLVVPVFMLYFTKFLNIFSCAIVGSYLVVVALDTYMKGEMRYIVLTFSLFGVVKDIRIIKTFLNIFSCAIVGSYLVVEALDTYLDGGMRYILNIFSCAIVGSYLVVLALDTYLDGGMRYIVLTFSVFWLFVQDILNIFSCAMVGSYLVVVALDTYLDGGMRYIVLNAIRHGTDVNYVKVIVTGPFTLNEIASTCVWIVLFLFGLTFQLIRERKKAPFPPCPRQLRNNRDLRTLLRRSTRDATREREPLIRGNNPDNTQNYGTSQEITASSTGEVSEEEVLNKPRVM